jgi:predicted amidohydrolase YtcJ
MPPEADRVFYNGSVHAMDDARMVATAIALAGGRGGH